MLGAQWAFFLWMDGLIILVIVASLLWRGAGSKLQVAGFAGGHFIS
jgi:hypothetical protein